MGELLRAVLDASCVQSNPSFYAGRVTEVSALGGARVFSRRQAFLQCKTDTWFLMQGWEIDVAVGATPPLWQTKTFPVQFSIRDAKTGDVFSQDQIQHSNAGFSLNNSITLPEYILWPPASLIGFAMDVPTQNTSATATVDTFVTLYGIEYLMPPGKGY